MAKVALAGSVALSVARGCEGRAPPEARAMRVPVTAQRAGGTTQGASAERATPGTVERGAPRASGAQSSEAAGGAGGARDAAGDGALRWAEGAARRESLPAVEAGGLKSAALGWVERTWTYLETPLGRIDVVVLAPRALARDTPVLVAFHGMGEARKGPARGARGWVDDYGLSSAAARLARPPLVSADFGGLVTPARLNRFNDALAARPFAGLVVLCPYLPAVLRADQAFTVGPQLADFVVDEVLVRARRELGLSARPAAVGVDGVSLGGRAALLVGASRPEAFGALGTLQPAIDGAEVERFADLLGAARRRQPGLWLRLLTSDDDYFLEVTRQLDRALARRALPHRLDVVAGDHSYAFNRGPGSYEMLFFHDRVLRGQEPL